jgi:hypothetical protein
MKELFESETMIVILKFVFGIAFVLSYLGVWVESKKGIKPSGFGIFCLFLLMSGFFAMWIPGLFGVGGWVTLVVGFIGLFSLRVLWRWKYGNEAVISTDLTKRTLQIMKEEFGDEYLSIFLNEKWMGISAVESVMMEIEKQRNCFTNLRIVCTKKEMKTLGIGARLKGVKVDEFVLNESIMNAKWVIKGYEFGMYAESQEFIDMNKKLDFLEDKNGEIVNAGENEGELWGEIIMRMKKRDRKLLGDGGEVEGLREDEFIIASGIKRVEGLVKELGIEGK